jgi:nitric oxide reductase large subunit
MWFWFGSQGYEYVDLGRFWQILLFEGLVLWLVLMVAALKPALVRKSEDRSLLTPQPSSCPEGSSARFITWILPVQPQR